MPLGTQSVRRPSVWNVPNQITMARLVLAMIVFALLPFRLYLPAMVLFIIAAGTDWIDGYWARKYGQVTKLGRILDPFADKIVICGIFIFLAAEVGSGIYPWMAVVVVGRELLVTALRAFIEQAGGDFSATSSGKWKMVLQSVAASTSLLTLYLGRDRTPDPLLWLLFASVWLSVVMTVYSGAVYVTAALRLIEPRHEA